MIYKKLYKSFLYWSARFSPDGNEQPFNALLMISACEMLAFLATLILLQGKISHMVPVNGFSLTLMSVLIFLLNFYISKRLKFMDATDVSNHAKSFFAPLVALLCISFLVVAVVFEIRK